MNFVIFNVIYKFKGLTWLKGTSNVALHHLLRLSLAGVTITGISDIFSDYESNYFRYFSSARFCSALTNSATGYFYPLAHPNTVKLLDALFRTKSAEIRTERFRSLIQLFHFEQCLHSITQFLLKQSLRN
jgi:hypothetical protein